MFIKMKQSSNHYKQTSKLTQYSSGEDDSGTEDIFTQKDFIFSSYLHRPVDLKQKKQLSPTSNLRQNRLRRTGMIDTPVLSVTPRIETSTIRKTSTRLVSSTLLPNPARSKHSASINAPLRHRSPVVRARLWSERNSDADLMDNRGTVLDSEISPKTRVLCETSDQVPNSSGSTNDNIHSFPRHGPLKKSDNCRRVLSDITKETVTDFRFQFPSYFSRDVLPLDASVNSKFDDLLSAKDRKSENSFVKKNTSNFEEPSANGIPARTRSTFSNSVDVSKEFKTTEEKGWFSLHYQKVSMILVVIVLLFFFGVGLIYLNVRFKDAQKNLSHKYESKYPVCDSSVQHQVVSCIREDQLNVVTSLFESITPQLMARASDSLCNSSKGSMSVSDKDVLDYIQSTKSVNRKYAENLLKDVKILVLSNPHWDVAVVQDLSLDDIGTETHRNEFLNDNLLHHGRLVFKNPLVPVSCQLKLWFKTFLSWVSSFTAVCIVVTGLLVALWDYKRRSEQHRQEVYTLVNKIISTVRNHHRRMQTPGADGTTFISVDVCRNEIITSQQSNYLSSAWNEAVRYIDVHESRILTEVHLIHGKPTKMWQWLNATSRPSEICAKPNNTNVNVTPEEPDSSSTASSFVPAHSSSSWTTKCRRNKVWQGKAFETIAGSPNSLPCSPTPCLKIRHMFDPDLEHGDDWPILIQDSILEKCEDVNVLHLFIDCSSQEGCVFMKCSSSEEAGKAYRALHGWWFDTKLVTVKYLRTERYHERFPEAVNASSSLRPSNNQRLSLQEFTIFVYDPFCCFVKKSFMKFVPFCKYHFIESKNCKITKE
ncbi:Inner nuclear membrane protein Man1, partial [Gryllus bimaculatus]